MLCYIYNPSSVNDHYCMLITIQKKKKLNEKRTISVLECSNESSKSPSKILINLEGLLTSLEAYVTCVLFRQYLLIPFIFLFTFQALCSWWSRWKFLS